MMLEELRGYRLGPAGEADSTFGQSGAARLQFPGCLSSQANDVVACADGKVLVALKVGFADGCRFGLARLHDDGAPDASFGDGGFVCGGFQVGVEAMASSVQLLADGRILLFGLHYLDEGHTLPGVARFDANGRLDPSFGDQGVKVLRLPGGLAEGPRDGWLPPGLPGVEACAGAVQEDGKILLIANHTYTFADYVGLLIRLQPDGTLDPTFNGRGFVVVRHLLMNSWLSCVRVQADGKILVGGSVNFPQLGLMVRYEPDGRLDHGFGDLGFLSFGFAGSSSQVTKLAAGNDGRLLCVGNRFSPMRGALQGFSSHGGTDFGFNDADTVLLDLDTPASLWADLLVQPDGSILVAGSTVMGFGSDFVLARYRADGRLDLDFAGGRGWVRTSLGHSLDTVTALAVQHDGRILVAGHSLFGSFRAVVLRYRG
ncbi:hypothetical protein HX882_07130 [Pseudomonas gingeri]|uniref:Delta-60 repeat domain-containing protein n=1 Tax=Pseudomonas gingeri TaxID=117681 RepID=A0A7Y7X9U1_9PSED|nr:hypothetical protein [Pseudomonas gingeri]NWB95661.1 hypothetical protein [Pseudomonas gingeri]